MPSNARPMRGCAPAGIEELGAFVYASSKQHELCPICSPSIESGAMNEIVFEVMQESDGGFVAEALGESIFTEGDS